MAYVFRGTDRSEPEYLNEPLPTNCGTRAGYQKHHRNKETACDECNQAHAEYMRDYMQNYIPRIQHGTMTGYRAHNKAGETPCDECRAVNAQYQADYKKRRARGQIRHGWTGEKCGTVAGYAMHYRYGVKVCPQCRAAQTIYQRSLKMQKETRGESR